MATSSRSTKAAPAKAKRPATKASVKNGRSFNGKPGKKASAPKAKKAAVPARKKSAPAKASPTKAKKAGVAKKSAKPVKRTIAKKATKQPVAKKAAANKKSVKPATGTSAVRNKATTGKKPTATATGKKNATSRTIAQKSAPVNGKTTATRPAKAAPKKSPAATPARSGTKAETKAVAKENPNSAPPPAAQEKKPAKERVQLEFEVRSAPTVLYELISTPSGFAEWYCDDVNVRGDQYTFMWQGEEEATTMIGRKLGEVIRFKRNDDDDEHAYFEFRVRIDAMTNEVALIVTDHAWPDEVDETRNLWNSQIANLMRVLGA